VLYPDVTFREEDQDPRKLLVEAKQEREEARAELLSARQERETAKSQFFAESANLLASMKNDAVNFGAAVSETADRAAKLTADELRKELSQELTELRDLRAACSEYQKEIIRKGNELLDALKNSETDAGQRLKTLVSEAGQTALGSLEELLKKAEGARECIAKDALTAAESAQRARTSADEAVKQADAAREFAQDMEARERGIRKFWEGVSTQARRIDAKIKNMQEG
jgi:cyclophilin family peptidyl-prolyl cis-trans isomerase